MGSDGRKPSFTVRVVHRQESVTPSPDRFWEPFRLIVGAESPPGAAVPRSARQFETALLRNFDQALTRRALEFRSVRLKGRAGKEPFDEPAAFAFQPHDLEYGSLTFPVDIVGVAALTRLLFGDPDLVLAFLDTCVPDAFLECVGAGPANLPLQISVTPGETLEAALAAGGPEASQGGGKGTWSDVMAKAQRVFWLLPTVLALLVLYVAAGMLTGERDRIEARYVALDARERQLQTGHEERIAKLEATTLELVKQLRAPTDKLAVEACCPVCCLPPKCPAQAPVTPRPKPSCTK